ncbi:MAG TPA: zinc-ribbon domain-containing protein [Limosilactobacillus coleohominis]|nr:zinc-ribbon domain-containing protein [Limosilactobacillus coleohominis]
MDNSNNQSVNDTNSYKFCSHCGAKIDAKAVVCPKCGVPVDGANINNNSTVNEPNPSAWWGVLGFFLPIIGWILYFVFKNEYPKRAHRCAVSAWWGFGVSFVIGFIGGVMGA